VSGDGSPGGGAREGAGGSMDDRSWSSLQWPSGAVASKRSRHRGGSEGVPMAAACAPAESGSCEGNENWEAIQAERWIPNL
jgi:hypothetical protein